MLRENWRSVGISPTGYSTSELTNLIAFSTGSAAQSFLRGLSAKEKLENNAETFIKSSRAEIMSTFAMMTT